MKGQYKGESVGFSLEIAQKKPQKLAKASKTCSFLMDFARELHTAIKDRYVLGCGK